MNDNLHKGIRAAEWCSLAVSASLVLGLAGYLVRSLSDDRPETAAPRIAIDLSRVEPDDGAFVLPVDIENPGKLAVSHLTVALSSKADGQETRTREITYLASGETRTLYFVYTADPSQLQLSAVVESYERD